MPATPADITRLYRRKARALLVFFQRRVNDPEAATDLMSETFAIAFERRQQSHAVHEDELSGWLWAIARSVLNDYERQQLSRRRSLPRMAVERRALTDLELERVDELGAIARLGPTVMRHVDGLPPDAALAVRMRFVDEETYETIARRLSITPSGARTLVSRALRQLSLQLRAAHDRELR